MTLPAMMNAIGPYAAKQNAYRITVNPTLMQIAGDKKLSAALSQYAYENLKVWLPSINRYDDEVRHAGDALVIWKQGF